MEILTENVLYVIEALHFCDESIVKLSDLKEADNEILFKKVKDEINLAIQICFNCNESNYFVRKSVKFEIFSFLVANYYDRKFLNFKQIPTLSPELIIDLAIENQLEDMPEVKKKILIK